MLPIGDEESRPGSSAVVVWTLIAVNVLIYFLCWSRGQAAENELIFQYGAIPRVLTRDLSGTWYTALTSMFMHGGWAHLLGNMLFLWVFADNIEDLLGEFGFLLFYLMCGAAALAAHVAMDPTSKIPVVGASGAISGVLGAYIVTFPRNDVRTLYFIVFLAGFTRVPAWLYLGIWFGMQLLGRDPGVAFGAHIGGFIAGVVLIHLFPKRQEPLDWYAHRTAWR